MVFRSFNTAKKVLGSEEMGYMSWKKTRTWRMNGGYRAWDIWEVKTKKNKKERTGHIGWG